jgi:hypothetical protein
VGNGIVTRYELRGTHNDPAETLAIGINLDVGKATPFACCANLMLCAHFRDITQKGARRSERPSLAQ